MTIPFIFTIDIMKKCMIYFTWYIYKYIYVYMNINENTITFQK